ncbi:DUF3307 domain-containing protein [Planotetraspora sp. A-T 1434]|uniref:DUF3307 domain-containing protein n=1 Tax=Planotetraspora sp. A-T 1434 TaxID=2979219 RepID=UPI0021C1537B|nr:DUF3307 domain-containing protein [Planotetraspora sp. A-T 1434]MCT9929565.1 DUF3307 domain-containing protein [Planotetraspora sp. A-T 1434]
MNATGDLGAVFASLYAAHMVADHWVQTHGQALTKSTPTWAGRLANTAHVATYTATALLAVTLMAWRTGLPLDPARLAAGLLISAVTHWWADRRHTLRSLAVRVGKGDFADLATGGMNGLYLLDQSWHIGWLFIAALIIT